MLEEEAGVMRNAMTTRAPGGAKNPAPNSGSNLPSKLKLKAANFVHSKAVMQFASSP